MAAPGGVLLVEWPLPWPRDVREVPELTAVVDAAAALGARVLLVAADAPSPDGSHTVCWYRPPDPSVVARFEPVERRCQRDDVAQTALALLAGAPGDVRPPAGDLVVCTHGRRDTCCGGSGTTLYRSLQTASLPADVRLWRSSHQGGHRFAPTALVLPDATAWAYLDVDLVTGIVRRDLPVAAVIDHYRGCAGFADPQLQALDGMALAAAGWRWLDEPRSGRQLAPTRFEVSADPARYEGVVRYGKPYHLPPCGSMPESGVPLTEHAPLEVMAYRQDN